LDAENGRKGNEQQKSKEVGYTIKGVFFAGEDRFLRTHADAEALSPPVK